MNQLGHGPGAHENVVDFIGGVLNFDFRHKSFLLESGLDNSSMPDSRRKNLQNCRIAGRRAASQCVTDAGRLSYILWAPRPAVLNNMEKCSIVNQFVGLMS